MQTAVGEGLLCYKLICVSQMQQETPRPRILQLASSLLKMMALGRYLYK
jgi:hypothetical protein